MDIQRRKQAIVEEFMSIQNEALVSLFEQVLKRRKSFEKEASPSPMSIEQLNEEIDKALADYQNGKVKDAKTLLLEIDKWN
jgi:soluble cytochrome b562